MNMQLRAPKNTGNKYCGPSAISAITGIGTAEAATVIRSITGQRAVKGTRHSAMEIALYKLGYRTKLVKSSPDGKTKPTLAQWLKASKEMRTAGRIFLVCAGHHYQVISGRRYVCGIVGEVVSVRHEGVKRRARVTKVWEVEKFGEPTFRFPAKRPNYQAERAKAVRIAKEIGVELEKHWMNEPGRPPEWWVYAPEELKDSPADPYEGDHLAFGWDQVLERVLAYQEALKK